MVRRILAVLLIAGLLFVLPIVGLWIALQPPVLEVPGQERLVFSNVTVVNPGVDRRAGRTLTVDGGRIESILADDPGRQASEATERFAGAYVLPGLIDMHVHHSSGLGDRELFGLLFLAHGVTAVRDTGDLSGAVLEMRRQVREGEYPGPRIFSCGPVLDGDPPLWPEFLPGSWPLRTPAEARDAVDALAEVGVDCVKVYSLLSPETLAAIRDRAAQHGLPVIGHVPLAVPFEEAQLRDAQHLYGVARVEARPLAGGAGATTRQQRFASAVAADWRGLDAARVDFVVEKSLEQGIAHTPTLVAYAHASRLSQRRDLLRDPAVQLLPRFYREVIWRPPDAMLQAAADMSERLPEMTRVVRRLHEAGVRVLAGSDTPNPFVVPGASLHQELRHLREAGFTVEEAWSAATRWAGESLGEPGLGTLQEGAPADFLLFREDPSRDLSARVTLEGVVAQGRLFPKEVLDGAIHRHRAYFQGWLYDRISMTVAKIISWGVEEGAES